MKKEKSTNARWWILAVCAIRILGALYILVNPFWGLIISLFLDYLDSIVLMDYAGFSFREYQKVDKRIDWTTYPFMLIAATRVGYYDIFLGLLLFRLVGQIMFEILKNERVLLVFPNVFEVAFFAFVALRSVGIFIPITNNPAWIEVIALTVIRELWLHWVWPTHIGQRAYRPFSTRLMGLKDRRI